EKAKISTVLEQWRQQGNTLNPSLVRGIFEKLRDSKRYPQALEVSQWMTERKICTLVPEDYTARFDLVESVLGLEEAEKFLERVPENLRGEPMYTALLKSYAKSGKKTLDRAEAAFEKMRELGLLLKPSPYSSMTSLYGSVGNRVKIDEILREMKDNDVKLDSHTVSNVLRAYAAESDVASMEKFLVGWEEEETETLQLHTVLDMAKAYLRVGSKREAREMLLRAEVLNEPASYVELMRLYGEAGKCSEDVYRIWNLYKKTGEQKSEGFLALIRSLCLLDDTKGAAEMYYKEYVSSGLEFDVRIPTTLVSAFRKKGMVREADNLTNKTLRNKELADKEITPLLKEWGKPSELRDLIKNLKDSNQFSKALEASSWLCDQKVISLFPEDYADRLDLTEKVFGLKEADEFFEKGIPEKMKGFSVYSTLLNSYTRSYQNFDKAEAIFEKMGELGFLTKLSPFKSMISLYSVLWKRVEIDNLLRKMKEKNIEPDSATMNCVLRAKAYASAVDLMDEHKSQWVDDGELKLEVETMEAMAAAYEKAGSILKAVEMTTSTQEVYRLRDTIEKMGNEEYVSVIRSLLKLGDVKGAEEMYGEWAQSKGGEEFDARIPGLLIARYCEVEGDETKARQMLNSSRRKVDETEFELFMKDMGWTLLFIPAVMLCTTFPPLIFILMLGLPEFLP
ncbi:putative pentatricopeptide repeat-containing protein At1g28020, partial [Raphanus sativus]|uniref:Pentatricopeptide repeat-containing protein At1g28020 n=1 Tax=Raphanus sativus TaxID=3726 RepID=A0A9W3CT52_RAPSA